MASAIERIVVTGASGFIGGHLLDHLVRSGLEAVAVSRRGTGRTDVLDLRVDDYTDEAALAECFRGASAVVHLAARAHQPDTANESSASLYEKANVEAAAAVARASRLTGVRRLVLISSIGVNGNQTQGSPFTTRHPPRPMEEYARSKLKGEQAVATELQHGPTDFVVLRPPLVYGRGCPGNFARLLQLIARSPLVPLGAVNTARTFICVDNLVDAVPVAARHPAVSRRTFLISDAQTLTLAQLASSLVAALGRSPRRVVSVPPNLLHLLAKLVGKGPAIEKLIVELQVDTSEFSEVTGWRPPVTTGQGLEALARDYTAAQRKR